MFQEAVSFLKACAEGVSMICLRSGHHLYPYCVGAFPVQLASLMTWSMYPVFTESFVSCSLIIGSWLMLCSAAADLSVCVSHVYCVL